MEAILTSLAIVGPPANSSLGSCWSHPALAIGITVTIRNVIVEVSGHQFVFPPVCACCHQPANGALAAAATRTQGKKVVHSQTHVWNLPYCGSCLAHVKKTQQAQVYLKVLTVLGAILCFIGFFQAPLLGLFLLVILVGLGVFLFSQTIAAAKSMCGSSCCHHGVAATFLGWRGTVNVFNFLSKPYALSFMVANQRKLVNVSAEAAHLLNSAGASPTVRGAQYAQKYRS